MQERLLFDKKDNSHNKGMQIKTRLNKYKKNIETISLNTKIVTPELENHLQILCSHEVFQINVINEKWRSNQKDECLDEISKKQYEVNAQNYLNIKSSKQKEYKIESKFPNFSEFDKLFIYLNEEQLSTKKKTFSKNLPEKKFECINVNFPKNIFESINPSELNQETKRLKNPEKDGSFQESHKSLRENSDEKTKQGICQEISYDLGNFLSTGKESNENLRVILEILNDLQKSHKELKSSNEELKSSNEEINIFLTK